MPQISTESYVDLIQKIYRAVHSDNMVSLYVKSGRFYLSNRFFEQFRTVSGMALEIWLDGSIILKESKRKKKVSQYLQSKKVSQWICNQYGIQENAKLVFFPLKESGYWKGQLIPGLKHTYGWDRMEQYTEMSDMAWEDRFLIYSLQRYYYQAIERDEIRHIYKWGSALAEKTYDRTDEDFRYYKLSCIVSLLKELAVCQRKPCKEIGEFNPHFHTCDRLQSTYEMAWGSYSSVEDRMMLEVFMTLLTDEELFVLSFIMKCGSLGKVESISFGREMKKWMTKAHMTLKQKACEYWGREYICSYFVTGIVF